MGDDIAAALTALIAAIREQVRHELRAEMSASAPAPDESQGPLLLSLPEAREKLRVSKATLDRLMARGRIGRVKIGSRAFIPSSEVERFIAEAQAD
ncbi:MULTISPECIES: helix-turn-helix domain-containing protein [Mycobacteroides]|uniref:helix-turn-helix domain-containing protein n=1 Tax=Mycobacteroides TaxID=670516 RepID=UPI0008A8935C|nr:MULTISPECIES: helix-turn-helix domain-containing protein [Mycobacteroides]AYM40394.1 DNA-binding protein [[Mycobacterium] chelonae subsp. gwanakae]OHU15981.1 hypothetical protein BKG75_13145 [Mycobacteroides chelonae]SIF23569.1 DNA-binding protein, excisionase family [Mycobacteroides abscessus subsp. abscessus]SIF37625.1 DNA-binding protein, excisionase family [Mycobacteroides abscessus subsp. abscessus]SIF85361.1 DNA-binding protein, excisionase family [Mycobacteroides abscessus subsp. abs